MQTEKHSISDSVGLTGSVSADEPLVRYDPTLVIS